MNNQVFVTGCGCSGTMFVSNVLLHNNISACHDKYHKDSDVLVTNAIMNGFARFYTRRNGCASVDCDVPLDNFSKVIHVCREPLKTIGSLMSKWKRFGSIWPHAVITGKLQNNDVTLHNAMTYWYNHNMLCLQEQTGVPILFEQILQDHACLFVELDRPVTHVREYTKRVNSSRNPKNITYSDLQQTDNDLTENIHRLYITLQQMFYNKHPDYQQTKEMI